MNKRILLTGLCLGIAVAFLIPGDLLASVDAKNTFDVKDIGDHTNKIQPEEEAFVHKKRENHYKKKGLVKFEIL